MTFRMWPGDEFVGDNGKRFKIERLVAVIGDPDCTHAGCRRRYGPDDPPGGTCMGYHCSLCGAPCSMVGHACPRAGDVAA